MAEPTPIMLPPLVTLPDVEITAVGTWRLASGEETFTAADLAAAVEAVQCPAIGDPVIELGHFDPRYNPDATPGLGIPAIGRVTDMALSPNGTKINANLAGMPGWLGAIAASAFPKRSIDARRNVVCQIGHLHSFVITGLALLGVTPPGVGVLGSLADVAALYGIQAASSGQPSGEPMSDPIEAAVTMEDVRRAYYDDPHTLPTYWITSVQLAPPQLIVCDDATSSLYRVPIKISGSSVSFGDAVEVEIVYDDVAAAAGLIHAAAPEALVFASAEESRAGIEAAWDAAAAQKNLGDNPSKAKLKQLYALPGDNKSDSKLPHHDVSTAGVVGAANDDGCSAAIGALNGGRGGLSGVSAAQRKSAYNHLAAHLRADGKEPPPLQGSAEPEVEAAAHGAMNGTHSHAHAAMGAQGGDETHDHSHTHNGDAVHDHAHASAGGPQEGSTKVDLSTEQETELRKRLGLKDDVELTPEHLMAALATPDQSKDPAPAEDDDLDAGKVAAAAGLSDLPPNVMVVDKTAWDRMQADIEAANRDLRRRKVAERDEVIQAAIRAGKFPPSERDTYRKLWDSNPDVTRQMIKTLRANMVPTTDIGASGSEMDDELDQEYRSLFPDQYKAQHDHQYAPKLHPNLGT